MSKLNEETTTSSISNVEPGKIDEPKKEKTEISEVSEVADIASTEEEDCKDILKFTPFFNKYNYDLDVKKSSRRGDQDDSYRGTMFFNKEVTIRPNSTKTENPDKELKTQPIGTNRSNSKFCSNKSEPEFGKPQISEPDMMFSNPNKNKKTENLRRFLNKRNSKIENDSSVLPSFEVDPRTDIRSHNSLTSLSSLETKGDAKSRIPSLTALTEESSSSVPRFGQWDHWDDLVLMQSDAEKRLNLQISRSSNDNNRRCSFKTKKDDVASVSDSKLLLANLEPKKQIKKCDKKSRGDSYKRERDVGGRKQVQWKREVDVIYFSTHLAANGDRSGEVLGRVMEPLREEWEQQRQGFYAKLVPYHIESHLKDRFISLLKI